jgi:hypothetical protein
MRYLHFILIICLFLASCRKEASNRASTSEYFPNSIGDKWTYKYVDSVNNNSVFVDVTIVGSTILFNGQNAKIWTYAFPNHVDTAFVYQVGDTIRFLDRGFSTHYTYVTPLAPGSLWRTNPDYVYDSIKIIDNRSLYANGETFSNSFLLYQVGRLPNDFWNSSEWFCPYVGMVTKNERDNLTITNEHTNISWELVSYNLR